MYRQMAAVRRPAARPAGMAVTPGSSVTRRVSGTGGLNGPPRPNLEREKNFYGALDITVSCRIFSASLKGSLKNSYCKHPSPSRREIARRRQSDRLICPGYVPVIFCRRCCNVLARFLISGPIS
jgi:hypothetical protein